MNDFSDYDLESPPNYDLEYGTNLSKSELMEEDSESIVDGYVEWVYDLLD